MTEHLTADEYHDLIEPVARKKTEHHEYNLHVSCWNHWKAIRPPDWFATSRELATKSAAEGERNKAKGCIPGLYDTEFWLPPGDPRRRLHGECKDAKSRDEAMRKRTPAQVAMVKVIEAHGEAWDLFWSVQSFVDMLTRHGIPWVQPRHMKTAEQRDIDLAARRMPREKKAGTGKKRKEGVTAAHKRFHRKQNGL